MTLWCVAHRRPARSVHSSQVIILCLLRRDAGAGRFSVTGISPDTRLGGLCGRCATMNLRPASVGVDVFLPRCRAFGLKRSVGRLAVGLFAGGLCLCQSGSILLCADRRVPHDSLLRRVASPIGSAIAQLLILIVRNGVGSSKASRGFISRDLLPVGDPDQPLRCRTALGLFFNLATEQLASKAASRAGGTRHCNWRPRLSAATNRAFRQRVFQAFRRAPSRRHVDTISCEAAVHALNRTERLFFSGRPRRLNVLSGLYKAPIGKGSCATRHRHHA